MSDNILQKVLKTGLWDPSQSIELVALINLDAESASGMLIASILERFYVPIELRNAGRLFRNTDGIWVQIIRR